MVPCSFQLGLGFIMLSLVSSQWICNNKLDILLSMTKLMTLPLRTMLFGGFLLQHDNICEGGRFYQCTSGELREPGSSKYNSVETVGEIKLLFSDMR